MCRWTWVNDSLMATSVTQGVHIININPCWCHELNQIKFWPALNQAASVNNQAAGDLISSAERSHCKLWHAHSWCNCTCPHSIVNIDAIDGVVPAVSKGYEPIARD